MPHLSRWTAPLLIILLGMLVSCSQPPASSSSPAAPGAGSANAAPPAPPPDSAPAAEASDAVHPDDLHADGAHLDHYSKHGGTFFMALDNYHHLEGVLVRPGIFRVYIYDAYTRPVSPEELAKTEATVIWGDKDGSPQIELKPNADGSALEAQAPEPVRFPVTLTLLCRFPGAAPNTRAELFTFPFSHYSHVDTTPHTH